MMKVLIFTPQFHLLGGAERSVVELAIELNKQGIHTDILGMYSDDGETPKKAVENLKEAGIPKVHFLGMKVNPAFSSLFKAIYRLRQLVKAEGYTVVEASMLSPSIICILSFLGKNVDTVIGIRHVYKKGRENSIQHRLFNMCSRVNKRVKYYAISGYAKNAWIKFSKIKENNCSVVYNSIPSKFFEVQGERDNFRKELGIPIDAKVAVYIGRYAAYKGIDVAFDALKDVVLEKNIYLLFIGHPDLDVTGTGEILKRIESEINIGGLGENIRFLGVRNDIDRVMSSSDVLVHPTRTEAFGRSLAEALASKLPVIATNVEAIPEVLSETYSKLIPIDSPHALKDAVLSVLNKDKGELNEIKDRGSLKAESFRIEKRTQAMLELFKKDVIG